MAAGVLWHVTMSLDGFIAGPGDAMDWAFGHGRPGPVAAEVIADTGAILAGRRCYDAGSRPGNGSGGIYGGAWSGPVFVLTHHPPSAPDDSGIIFVSEGIESAVSTACEAAAGQAVGVLGASIARQCIEHGLLDEIIVHLVPLLLGEGVRFYEAAGVGPVRLERNLLAGADQITDLRFRVIR